MWNPRVHYVHFLRSVTNPICPLYRAKEWMVVVIGILSLPMKNQIMGVIMTRWLIPAHEYFDAYESTYENVIKHRLETLI